MGKGPCSLLSGQVTPAAGLEANDDVGDLQVPLFLQVGEHSCPEEHFALANAVQVTVELQGFDLEGGKQTTDCTTLHTGRNGQDLPQPSRTGVQEWLHLLQEQRAQVSGTLRVGVTQSKVTMQTARETQDSSETSSTSCLCTWSHAPQALTQDVLHCEAAEGLWHQD